MPETAETILNALRETEVKPPKPKHKYSVLERDYHRERVVFSTDDREAAVRVKNQHAARRVILNG